jgi:hypothetical protein
MEYTQYLAVQNPEVLLILSVILLCTLALLAAMQYYYRKLELRLRVLIEGHQAYYRAIHRIESGEFSETNAYKQYWHEEYKKRVS